MARSSPSHCRRRVNGVHISSLSSSSSTEFPSRCYRSSAEIWAPQMSSRKVLSLLYDESGCGKLRWRRRRSLQLPRRPRCVVQRRRRRWRSIETLGFCSPRSISALRLLLGLYTNLFRGRRVGLGAAILGTRDYRPAKFDTLQIRCKTRKLPRNEVIVASNNRERKTK